MPGSRSRNRHLVAVGTGGTIPDAKRLAKLLPTGRVEILPLFIRDYATVLAANSGMKKTLVCSVRMDCI
jgi:hypothetical protein